MNKLSTLSMLIMSIVISGCGTMPQTAEEFRQMAPGSIFGEKESFVVNRSVSDVANTFNKMTEKCLNKRIEMTESGYMYHHVVVTQYTPTVRISENKAELYVQFKHEKGVKAVRKMPPKGYYLTVIDAIGINSKKTRIDFYRPNVGHKPLVKALRGWAKNENVGCPDLTKS